MSCSYKLQPNEENRVRMGGIFKQVIKKSGRWLYECKTWIVVRYNFEQELETLWVVIHLPQLGTIQENLLFNHIHCHFILLYTFNIFLVLLCLHKRSFYFRFSLTYFYFTSFSTHNFEKLSTLVRSWNFNCPCKHQIRPESFKIFYFLAYNTTSLCLSWVKYPKVIYVTSKWPKSQRGYYESFRA